MPFQLWSGVFLFSSRDQLEASWAHLARVLTIAVLVNSCGARFESDRIRVVNGEPVLKKPEAISKYLSDRSSTHLSAYYVCFLASRAHTVWVCRLLTWFEPSIVAAHRETEHWISSGVHQVVPSISSQSKKSQKKELVVTST